MLINHFLILFTLICSACSSPSLNPHDVPPEKRLVFGRLNHFNGKENYTYATTLKYETGIGGLKDQDIFNQTDVEENLSPGYFWGTISREANNLTLLEISYPVNDHLMSVGKNSSHHLAEAHFSPGPSPLYIGEINLITEGNKREIKVLEFFDHHEDAENYLRKNYDFSHPLTKALLKSNK